MSSGEADAIRVAHGDFALRAKPEQARRVIAITGIPGAGKSTLAAGIASRKGWQVLSTGDIARRVDPASLAVGGMADEIAFQGAFRAAMDEVDWSNPVILDGIPRSKGQIILLPYFTRILALNCRPDVAKDRLLRRGRPDDTEELIDRRIKEQTALLDVEHADGWLYQMAGWGAVVNTTYKSVDMILGDVLAYLDGEKKQAF